MDLIGIIILIIVCGVALWAVNEYIPMQPGIKKLLNVLVIAFLAIIVIFFLLGMLGVGGVPRVHLG